MESMEGLVFKSIISDLAEVTSAVSSEIFEEASLKIQKSMEEHEFVLRAEQSESEKIASETILNF
jgi:hypothetical protein